MNEQAETDFTQRMAYVAKLVGNATVLARRTKISRRAIGTYLSGASDPTRERLVSLAQAAGVCVRWLATGEGPIFSSDNEDIRPFVVSLVGHINKRMEQVPATIHSNLAAAGFSGHRMRKIRMGEVVPSLRELQTIANILGLDTDDLLAKSVSIPTSCTKASLSDKYTTLPQNQPAAEVLCTLCYGKQQVTDKLSFRHDWLNDELGVDTSHACLFEVGCEGMCPTFRPGDLVLVSCSDLHRAPADGIYIVSMGGDAMIKRVQKLPGNKLRVSSDNALFESYVLDFPLSKDVKLLGRVLWSGRRF